MYALLLLIPYLPQIVNPPANFDSLADATGTAFDRLHVKVTVPGPR